MIESAKWTKVTSGGPALYPCMHFVKLFCDGAWWPFTRPRTRVHVILPNCVTRTEEYHFAFAFMPGGPKLGCDRETATKFLTVATGGKRARACTSSSSNLPGAVTSGNFTFPLPLLPA